MSESSIDVDINFHFNDIKNLFEKALEGSDIDLLKEISNKENTLQSSLLQDIELTEDKTKLLEALTNLNAVPILENINKMFSEMNLEQDGQSEVIKRTQKTMVTLLTLSKTMLKIFESKFPLTDDMQKDLDDMNTTLSDQKLSLDDMMDTLLRSFNNIFAPIKEKLPSAFKITKTPDLTSFINLLGGNEKGRTQLDIMRDFAKQASNTLKKMVNRAKAQEGRIRLLKNIPEMEDIANIGDKVQEVLNQIIEVFDEKMKTEGYYPSESRYILGGDMITSADLSSEARNTFDIMETTITKIRELFEGLVHKADTAILNIDTSLHELVNILDEQKDEITTAIDLLVSATTDIKSTVKEVKKAVKEEVGAIKNVLGEDYYQGTISDIMDKLILMELLDPVHTTTTAKKLEHLVSLAEGAINVLSRDFEKLFVGKTREEISAMGLSDLSAVKPIVELVKDKKSKLSTLEKVLYPSRGGDTSSHRLDMGLISENVKQIFDRINSLGVKDDIINNSIEDLIVAVEKTRKVASDNLDGTRDFGNTLNKVSRLMEFTTEQLSASKGHIKVMKEKLLEVIAKVDINLKGREINTSELDKDK